MLDFTNIRAVFSQKRSRQAFSSVYDMKRPWRGSRGVLKISTGKKREEESETKF